MYFENFDRQFFDTLIFIVFGVGVIAAGIRLYQDFTRPLPPENGPRSNNVGEVDDEDTRPHPPVT